MTNKKLVIHELENELFAVMKKMNQSSKRANERLYAMALTGNKAVEGLLDILQNLQANRHGRNSEAADMTRRLFDSDSAISKKELLSMKAKFEEIQAETDVTHATIDEIERAYFKYNIPKRGSDPKPLESYLVRVREFMRFIWREMAEISRRGGYKSLLEWMEEIDRSGDEEQRAASAEMRKVLVDTWLEISVFLMELLWMISVFKEHEEIDERLANVKAVIGCLSVEEGSAIINCFIGVVEQFRGTVRKAKRAVRPSGDEEEEGGNGSKWAEDEAELFWMIVVEILRLEVAFRCPDSLKLLESWLYRSMAHHLAENVFKGKLAAILNKIVEIQTKMQPQSQTDLLEEFLNSGVKEVWKGLDLDAKKDV